MERRPVRNNLKAKPKGLTVSTSTQARLAEARRLVQQASRKPEGPARSEVLKSSVDVFRTVIPLLLSVGEREEALFDLGETLLQLSGSVQVSLGVVAGFLHGSITKPQAVAAHTRRTVTALQMCRESTEAFENVYKLSGGLAQEALVNWGVALSSCAELTVAIPESEGGGARGARFLVEEAQQRLSAALQVAPVDVEVLVNYADCCARRAEFEADLTHCYGPDGWENTKGLYEQSLRAFSSACANADSRTGDDLPGLLYNWGSCLFSLSQREPNYSEALSFVAAGREKVLSAFKFRPTDITMRLGFGELLSGVVDRLDGKATAGQQLEFLRLACEEGYGAALKIDAINSVALLGLGDIHLTSGKLQLLKGGSSMDAQSHFEKSDGFFERAFESLQCRAEEICDLSYEDLCDAMYNWACAAARSGRTGKAIECLEHLSSLQSLCIGDAADDPDLLSLRSFFQLKLSSPVTRCIFPGLPPIFVNSSKP